MLTILSLINQALTEKLPGADKSYIAGEPY